MEITFIALLISFIALLYVAAIWFVLTRWLIRTLKNKRPPPPQLELIVRDCRGKVE